MARASFLTTALLNGRPEDWGRRRSRLRFSPGARYAKLCGEIEEASAGTLVPGSETDPRELEAALAEKESIELTPEELRRWAEDTRASGVAIAQGVQIISSKKCKSP